MGLRARIILLTCSMLAITFLLFGIATFKAQEKALSNGIAAKLEATARLAREILPPDYHDRITGADSVMPADYLQIVDRWNGLCKQLGLEYIWSLILIDGKIVFTSGSSTSKDVNKGDHAIFFEPHSSPEQYTTVFATMKPQYQINDDKWGRIQAVLVPFHDTHGRSYMFGASMKTTEVDGLTRKMVWKTLGISVPILLLGIILSVLLAGSLVRPLENLTALARNIAQGNWGDVVETSGTIEIQSLAHNINVMSQSIREEIAERKREEEALRESEERFRNVLQDVHSVAVQGYAQDGTTQYWNQASERLYGYTAQEAIGRNLIDLIIPPEMQEGVKQMMLQMAETGEPIPSSELSLLRKDGSRIEVFSSHTIVQIPGRAQELFCIDIDLTERKRAEAEKARLEGQLQHAQKMESVGRLAGGVAHDFNNMLGVILGRADLLLRELDPSLPAYAEVQEIHKAATRSAELTRQLLAFARRQTVAPRVLDLSETVEGTLKMLRRLIGEDIRLSWLPGSDLWPIKVDPSQIDQILANLCVNARDAIADIGKITIETGNVTFDEEYCAQHFGFRPGDYVRMAVSDNGCGMDKEMLTQIFEPFFTTKGVGKGTGLGLAMVYGVVKQNNGFINAYSELGSGTTFSIYLPRHAGKVDQVWREPVAGLTASGQETILLVEDEATILKLTTVMLQKQGYNVLAADTPGEAIRLAGEYRDKIHLLMTDVVMPEMNGRNLAQNIRTTHPHIKRLFMSGYTANVIAHHGVLDEGVCFIQKPFSMQDLATKVREALASET